MRLTTLLIVSTLFLSLLSGYAAAQADTLKVDYFSNANLSGVPDGTLRLTNPGTTGGSVCAAIFVFDPLEEIYECCSCMLSTNDLRTLSVNNDLTSNTLTGLVITTGTISVVSTATVGGQCPLPTTLTPTSGGVRAWTTHIDTMSSAVNVRGQTLSSSGYVGTAAPSQDVTLSSYEEQMLARECYAVEVVGSEHGICTCGTGD